MTKGQSEVIHVGMYGGKDRLFGGKEKPLEVSIIHCDRKDLCTFFQNGQCLNVRRPLSRCCKFGLAETKKGYTSRAKKYHTFKNEWDSHPQLGKLVYPPTKLGIIDDYVFFPYAHIRIEKEANGEFSLNHPNFGRGEAFIDKDKFTVDFIYKVCTFQPRTIMDRTIITSYQKKVVPTFLAHLKEVMPDLFDEFTVKYPEYREVDYVGRKALMTTINPSYVYYKANTSPDLNSEWYWDGELLTYKGGYVSRFNITSDYEIENITLRPNEKATVIITDNAQVNDNTVFVN